MPLFQMGKLNVSSNLLQDRYIVPPFSIMNTITQNWQKRKDVWESMGISSADGRDVKRNNANPVNTFSARGNTVKDAEKTSTFDPLLCEIIYKWFSNPDDKILDPFAGGSVRGIVAGALGRNYTGIDLSKNQVEENHKQLDNVCYRYNITGVVEWIQSDSDRYFMQESKNNDRYDMIFTCPPYFNLEKYSNDPNDLSTMHTYEEFLVKYKSILAGAVTMLNDNRFMVIVVSEIRDSGTGEYYGFVPDTINILRNTGLHYYNEIILENNIGSLPIRAPKYFDQSRKIGRHHQNILVFWKGNTKNIPDRFDKFFDHK